MSFQVIDFTDVGVDLDDEQKLALAASLHKKNLTRLCGVVANLNPALDRAKLAKGTLNKFSLPDIPVGIGTSFSGAKKCDSDCEYANEVYESELFQADCMVDDILSSSEDKSITLSLNSGLTDAVKLCLRRPDLFLKKVREVVIMGGVVVENEQPVLKVGPDKNNYMVPDFAANNCFDYPSGLFLYQWLQENNVKMCILMREAAYAAQFPFSLYDEFAKNGHPVGLRLLSRQKPSICNLFKQATAPAGSEIRGKLPADRDRTWFVNVFCGGNDPGEVDDIWPFVKGYQQYDSLAYLACNQDLRQEFFNPFQVKVKDTTHEIIGVSKNNHGVKHPDLLRNFISSNQISVF